MGVPWPGTCPTLLNQPWSCIESHDKIDQGKDAKANVTRYPTGALQYLTGKMDNLI